MRNIFSKKLNPVPYTPYPYHRGFTLIEVLIVLGIGAILLGFGVVNLLGFKSGQSLEHEAQTVVTFLKGAQEKAIGEDMNRRWGVYFDTQQAPQAYSLYEVDEALLVSNTNVGIPGTVFDRHTLPSFRLQLPLGAVTSTIIFNKATGIISADTSVIIADPSSPATKTVSVSREGKIDYQ